MNNEKDMFIKNKLEEDKLISKKADDIFNKLLKGELNMEERIIKDEQLKDKVVSDTENKKQFNWKKKVLAIAASIVILFGAANVYASTQGYENIFFMIKYLITGEQSTIEGKDNILSDRDITISYEPINISKSLSITIKKMQVKDNQAKLFVVTAEKDVLDSNTVPLKFKVYNSENEMLCKQTSVREEQNSGRVEDELILENYKNNDTILNLEIYKVNEEKIATLKINLEEKTVEVLGEKEALNKISEIELKKFLGYVAGLSENKGDDTENEVKIDLAFQMLSEENNGKYIWYNNQQLSGYSVKEVNKMIESFLGEEISNFKNGNHIIKTTFNGIEYYCYASTSDKFYGGECINISNISYCNGLYTVTYTYYYRGPEPDEDVNMDSYDIYEQNIVISLNEESNYSKFKVISKEEPSIIKKAEANEEIEDKSNTSNEENQTLNNSNTSNTNSTTSNTENANNTNTSNEKIDNYATSMSWTEYWAPGIKFQYPTNFTLSEEGEYNRGNRQGEVSTRISGIATGINPDTKERIDSNLIIYIYEPIITKEDVSKYKYGSNGLEKGHLTTYSGIVWYDDFGEGKELPQVQTCTHIESLNDGYNAIYKIEFHTDKRDNYKVTNIVNWLLGSTKLTSY